MAEAAAELTEAREKLRAVEGELATAKGALDAVKGGGDAQQIAEAKLGVSKAELGVAKAELGVAKAELGVAKAEWQAAKGGDKAVFRENFDAARASVKSAQAVVETANIAYENALRAAAPPHGLGADVGSGAALEERFAAFLQTQQERDERLRKEQLQMRKEQQERDERLRKEQLQIIRHLALPENPWAEMARTSAASDTSSQVNFRTQLSGFYGYSESEKPKCIVTQMEDGKEGNRVVAAHVWPRSAASTFPFEHLENGVNNPSNGLLLHKTIEQNMDRLHVCFVCNPFDLSAEFVVLHQDILQQQLPGTDCTFDKLHKQKVQFTYEQRPSFQLLSKHAQQAFAHAGNQQWMEDKDVGDFKKVLQFGSPQSKMHDQRKGATD